MIIEEVNPFYINEARWLLKKDQYRWKGKGRRCWSGYELECRTNHLAARRIWRNVFRKTSILVVITVIIFILFLQSSWCKIAPSHWAAATTFAFASTYIYPCSYVMVVLFLALYSLEEDWTEIVVGERLVGEKERGQQTAIWELITTELAYIRTLKVIQDVSIYCLL